MPPSATLLVTGLAFVAGTAWQLQQAQLQPVPWTAVALMVAVVAAVLATWRLRRMAAIGLLAVTAATAGFALADLRAFSRLDAALDPALEGRDLIVVGVVDGLPDVAPERLRLVLRIESARQPDGTPIELPQRVLLGWYSRAGDAALPPVRAGERWQLPVRLKRPHGLANPHGFDYELWLFEQRLRATGYVRPGPALLRLGAADGHWIDRARQAVREALAERLVSAPRAANVLAALAVGDQGAIDRDDWALYRDTGIAHLMSISGVHVTMFAWLAGAAIGWLWRRSARAMHWLPAPLAARWGGLLCALGYALLAGFGVPAQRTLLMLASAVLLRSAGLVWRWPAVMLVAAVAVTLLDPWALLQPGFWLSFGAVALLLAAGDQPRAAAPVAATRGARLWRAAHAGLRAQWIATLGLAPLSMLFFQQVSVVGFVANLVAIPLVTLLITPLALLGVLLPPLWWPAAWAVQALNAGLSALLAASGGVVWTAAAAPAWAAATALLGALLFVLPLPWRWRALAVPLVVPLLWPVTPTIAPGTLAIVAADIGQGNAVLLRTAHHALLFDAGPQYSREADAGERVLRPLLRALGVARLDLLVLSHRDTDHVGGAAALLRALSVAELRSSLEPGHPLLALAQERGAAVARCEAGAGWTWDGVDFLWLHPSAALLDAEPRALPNALSCVLRVRPARGTPSLLLTGDIEQPQEQALLATLAPDALRADLLLVPHHGSVTSSSAAFLDAVRPRVALVQAGYRNRYGHPAPTVLARYRERGIALVQSTRCGAWTLDAAGMRCQRDVRRRYWQHADRQPAPPFEGAEVATLDGTDRAPLPLPEAEED